MTQKILIKSIASLLQITMAESESTAQEVQVLHTRINLLARSVGLLLEMLSDVIPEDQREQLGAVFEDESVPDQVARKARFDEFHRDQQAPLLAQLKALIERLDDE